MYDYLISGGTIVDGSGLPRYQADLAIVGDRIAAIGKFPNAVAARQIDARGLIVAPGMVDAHVHGDLILFHDPTHEAAIRQGVTTYIIGQDGVAMAPAGPKTLDYMRRYTAAFNGNYPTPGLDWQTLEEYLNCFNNRVGMNAAALLPNGNIRMEVMGLEKRPPTATELKQMRHLVREGMEQGAVGLSSGLDYIPSLYADVAEFVALCEEIAPYNGVYVTHMRGYTPAAYLTAMEEVAQISLGANCAVHISHFNSVASMVIPKMDEMQARGVDLTFDLYCYLFGSTLLNMLCLPQEVQSGGIEATLERLRADDIRQRMRGWMDNPRFDIRKIILGSVPAAQFQHLEGKTLTEAAADTGLAIPDLIIELLLATQLATNGICPHQPGRNDQDIVALMRDHRMMAGSDGIYVGGHPHPRGRGCFARYLGHYVRNGAWTLEQAVMKCSRHPARRHGLHDRGLLAPGCAADIAVFSATEIQDHAMFEQPNLLATGMHHVLVNGIPVLQEGVMTNSLPGKGLRRTF
ncbi:MAG: D-aminoacylase [Zavarzinella sp.]